MKIKTYRLILVLVVISNIYNMHAPELVPSVKKWKKKNNIARRSVAKIQNDMDFMRRKDEYDSMKSIETSLLKLCNRGTKSPKTDIPYNKTLKTEKGVPTIESIRSILSK